MAHSPASGFVVGSIVFCPGHGGDDGLIRLGDALVARLNDPVVQSVHLQVASLTARVRELEDLIVGPLGEPTPIDAMRDWSGAIDRERQKIKQKRGI